MDINCNDIVAIPDVISSDTREPAVARGPQGRPPLYKALRSGHGVLPLFRLRFGQVPEDGDRQTPPDHHTYVRPGVGRGVEHSRNAHREDDPDDDHGPGRVQEIRHLSEQIRPVPALAVQQRHDNESCQHGLRDNRGQQGFVSRVAQEEDPVNEETNDDGDGRQEQEQRGGGGHGIRGRQARSARGPA